MCDENSTPVERLIIEQILLCWVRLASTEMSYTETIQEGGAIEMAQFQEKRLNSAHKRYAQACETLARIRKLQRKSQPVQINIATAGGQQINLKK
jgi:hypothetical protein